jgi:hypothetical protein
MLSINLAQFRLSLNKFVEKESNPPSQDNLAMIEFQWPNRPRKSLDSGNSPSTAA